MGKTTRWIVPMVALLAVGCAPDDDADETAGAAPAAEAPPPPPAAVPAITVEVKGEGTGSAVVGQALVTPAADGFEFAVNLNGVPAGAHAWHIHQGTCGEKDTPVVVPLSGEPSKPGLTSDLTPDANGAVTATVQVPAGMVTVEQLKAGGYSLHVHEKTGADHGPTIACADLKGV